MNKIPQLKKYRCKSCLQKVYESDFHNKPVTFEQYQEIGYCPYCITRHGMKHPEPELSASDRRKVRYSLWSDPHDYVIKPTIFSPSDEFKLTFRDDGTHTFENIPLKDLYVDPEKYETEVVKGYVLPPPKLSSFDGIKRIETPEWKEKGDPHE